MSGQDELFRFLDTPRALPAKQPAAERVTHHREIRGPFTPADATTQSSRCLDCGNPYCSRGCPLHNDIPGWLKLVRAGRIIEACERMHLTNPLPEICGRVCPQERLCEGACTLQRGELGAVTIGGVERFAVDEAVRRGWRPDLSGVRETGRRVAIVGAGPAGLACADRLRRAGIAADVYDRHDEIGGLLMYGIPSFKLEKTVVLQRRRILEGMGVRFHLGIEIGRDKAFAELLDGYDAVFTATGAYRTLDGDLPGLGLQGVQQALPFLIGTTESVHAGKPLAAACDVTGRRVIVLGGGDTAMDCVRTAVRLGAREVTCVYRRDEIGMPGSINEVTHAREEGVAFQYRCQPLALLANALEVVGTQRVEGVRVSATAEVADTATAATWSNVPGSERVLAADAVIIAFGFRAAPPEWQGGLGIASDTQGRTRVGGQGRMPQQTAHPKVF
ncbi:MAG TPA: FAD-dependent oxidoreductase, partial [Rhodanobacteraceae bacterium]|nr:FAD-dependent oxidoreductase [Rhodanobacteraceae bacterium]